jgi:hypothetical protein
VVPFARLLTIEMNDILNLPVSRAVAFLVLALCFLSLVDGAIPQLELFSIGQLFIPEYLIKGALLAAVLIGCLIFPQTRLGKIPKWWWLLCVAYLIADIAYLTFARGMTVAVVLQSYSGYYGLLLIGPVLCAFRGRVSQRTILLCTVSLFLVCAAVGLVQYFSAQPLLFTESADGGFRVDSWFFFEKVRAFSLFTSAMNFGMFCALCGALGVALSRTLPWRGALLCLVSAVACFATLTRLCYVIFFCVCTYALVLTFGKKSGRGLWHPFLYFGFGLAMVVAGLSSLVTGGESGLQDASSLIQRIGQWTYYSDFLLHSSITDQLFGVGIVQNEKILPLYPMIIDNVALALMLHIGLVGFVLFCILMIKMWLFLRREALVTRQPFAIAAASLWAALACAGIFNIVFTSFGVVFALAVLCREEAAVPA